MAEKGRNAASSFMKGNSNKYLTWNYISLAVFLFFGFCFSQIQSWCIVESSKQHTIRCSSLSYAAVTWGLIWCPPIVLFAPSSATSPEEKYNKRKRKKKNTNSLVLFLQTQKSHSDFDQIRQLCQMGSYRHLHLQAFFTAVFTIIISIIIIFIISTTPTSQHKAQKKCLEREPQTPGHHLLLILHSLAVTIMALFLALLSPLFLLLWTSFNSCNRTVMHAFMYPTVLQKPFFLSGFFLFMGINYHCQIA